ncbi:MAG: photosynthetic reaction center cytochrome PufC [Pseudomonadota bacterium]
MNTSRYRAAGISTALIAVFFLASCERPPVDSVQRGYRGTGMELVINPRSLEESIEANIPPEPLPAVPAEGPRAGDVFQNVQVLGDMSVAEFTRLMAAITAWVSPEQGCNYCHADGNLADDNVYTKNVARWMIAMTQRINENWGSHVGETGVTCYTCHRGKNVPEYIWSIDPGPERARGLVAQSEQNIASPAVGYASLPYDPFTVFLQQQNDIRVISDTALPNGSTRNIMDTEKTYALMMHFSNALGVNCTYCHNSRNFQGWASGGPTRVTSWHGIQMVREVNLSFIEPTGQFLPENRLGPLGDVPKVNCTTCHQGAYKPLYGAQMAQYYPWLRKVNPAVMNSYMKIDQVSKR